MERIVKDEKPYGNRKEISKVIIKKKKKKQKNMFYNVRKEYANDRVHDDVVSRSVDVASQVRTQQSVSLKWNDATFTCASQVYGFAGEL